jgi:hypothetical protein
MMSAMRVGTLAFGSLIDDPGTEVDRETADRKSA